MKLPAMRPWLVLGRSILSHAVPLTAGINLLFALTVIVNSYGMLFKFGYRSDRLELVIFSPSVDIQVFWITYVAILLIPWLLIATRRKAPSLSTMVSHMVLPMCLLAAGFSPVTAAYLAIIAVSQTVVRAREILDIPKIRAASIVLLVVSAAYASIGVASLVSMVSHPAVLQEWLARRPQAPVEPPNESRRGTSQNPPTSALVDVVLRVFSLELQVFSVGYQFVRYILLIFLFAWAWIPISEIAMSFVRRILNRNKGTATSDENSARYVGQEAGSRILLKWLPRLGAVLVCALGIYLIQFPYQFNSQPLGVDARSYAEMLSGITTLDQMLSYMTTLPYVAPYLAILYATRALTGLSAEATVAVGPAILMLLLAIASYLFVAIAAENEYLALGASTLSILSVQTTVGLWAGVYSNWLALVGVAFFYYFMMRWIRRGSRVGFIIAIFMSLLVLVTHAWTWGLLIAFLACQAFLASDRRILLKGSSARRELALTLAIPAISAALVAALLLGASSFPSLSGVRSTILTAPMYLGSLQFSNITELRYSLYETLTTYSPSFLANSWLYALAILGAWEARKYGGTFQRIIFSWLVVSSILIMLLDATYQWRILFTVPYYVAASLGIGSIIGALLRMRKRDVLTRLDAVLAKSCVVSIATAFLLLFADYTLRSAILTAMYFWKSFP